MSAPLDFWFDFASPYGYLASTQIDDIAARCGFGAAALLRHHFRNVVGVAPADYRRTFRTAAPAARTG